MRLAGIAPHLAVSAAALGLIGEAARAEPYLAVESGLKCNVCHTNPTGGGKRTVFGMTYARASLTENILFADEDAAGWDSEVNRWLGVGGDYRGGYVDVDTPGEDTQSDWATRRSTVYLEIRAVPGLVTLYADEQVAPGSALNREAYLLVTPKRGRYTIKYGQMFLPFGLRLEDDTTFVRQRSGINFDTPDEGIELGLELPRWSAQAAFTDGTAGAGDAPGKAQTSLSASYVLPRWRLGASFNLNEDALGDRNMVAIFAGVETGPISWLAEIDLISDEVPGASDNEIQASLIEGNWRFARSHSLKVGYEFLDPSDTSREDEQERYSVVWEYWPFQLFQTRLGYRVYNGIPAQPASNRELLFLEGHVFF